jgi:predicted  nucleic acid-binding Zn-ribbon protein
MGPQCPHCGAVYEWTCGELEEQVTAPKVYFCQDCRGLFILAPEEIEALQERFRPALEEADRSEPCDGSDQSDQLDDDDLRPQPQPQNSPVQAQVRPVVEDEEEDEEDEAEQAEPLLLRERVRVVGGPYEGIVGAVAVIDNEQITLRVEGRNSCVRVSVTQLQRAA